MKPPLLKFLTFVLVLFAAGLTPLHASAAEGPGSAAVRQVNDAIGSLLRRKVKPGSPEEKQLAAEINARLARFLDVDTLGRRALADHWDKLSEADRKEFTQLLRKLVEASYLRALRANLEYEVRYLGETPREEARVVSTELRTKRKGRVEVIAVDYVVHLDGSEWRALDLVTDGVGMVENYRGQFNKIIAEQGFAGLLEKMRAKAKASN